MFKSSDTESDQESLVPSASSLKVLYVADQILYLFKRQLIGHKDVYSIQELVY